MRLCARIRRGITGESEGSAVDGPAAGRRILVVHV
jgi:hypothetical protein